MIRLFAAMFFLILGLTAGNAAHSTSRAKAELSSGTVNSAAPGEQSENAKAKGLIDRDIEVIDLTDRWGLAD